MRKLYCCILILLLFLGAVASDNPQDKKKPNILYIFTDDQSYRTVSAYSGTYEGVKTPNIDKLAKEGVLFSNCYADTWCMVSRATALTGLHQHAIKTLKMSGPYPQSKYNPGIKRFWPAVFRESSYSQE